MRGYLVSSIGLACAAVLTLPCAALATAAGTSAPAAPAVPGSTQSLPLVPFSRAGAAPTAGLTPQTVHSFALVGVVWDDPDTPLDGRVEIRTRATRTHRWSGWQELQTHDRGHGPDPGTAEAASGRVHGSTAPLWVGDSDGVEVRVRAQQDKTGTAALPDGLRVELVDPGVESHTGVPGAEPHVAAPETGVHAVGPGAQRYVAVADADYAAGAPGAQLHAGVVAPAVRVASAQPSGGNAYGTAGAASATPGVDFGGDSGGSAADGALASVDPMVSPGLPGHSKSYAAPRPRIVTRSDWGADEKLRETGFVYTNTVKVAFVHHTASGNSYTCSQAPSVIRSIYRYHVVTNGWRDLGYNFLVDKCGNIYEGRAGGVDKPVMGAHTLGFNSDSMGVAVIGSYSDTGPSSDALAAVAELTAWKLGLYGMDPRGRAYLESGGGNLYPKGVKARLNVISGHRDGYSTDCPGRQLYGKLDTVRSTAGHLQGR